MKSGNSNLNNSALQRDTYQTTPTYETETGRDQPAHAELVWQQINAWVWVSECGRFKIERFIPGYHESVGRGFTWPDRYRVLKHTPAWYFEVAPSELTLAAAQAVCEGLTVVPRGTNTVAGNG